MLRPTAVNITILFHCQKKEVYMNRLFYPALFHKADEGGFWVSFPDLPECLTQGNDMAQAYEMAVDALGLAISHRLECKESLPDPSELSSIILEDESVFVIVEFDMLAYKKRNSSKAVKKTLTIPEWINEEATLLGINFSQVLQEALLQKIQSK